MNFKLTEKQKRKLDKIAKDNGIKFVVLHGSRATGKSRGDSDLDIAFLAENKLSFEEITRLFSEFEGVFGNTLERDLDLKQLNHKPPLFVYHVVRDGILLYGDETDYNEFRSYAFKRHIDSKPLYDFRNDFVRQRIKKLIKEVHA